MVTGSQRAINVWVYSADQKTLYSDFLKSYENGGTTTQKYKPNKPHKKGTKIAVLYRDYKGGVAFPYETGGYIDYY